MITSVEEARKLLAEHRAKHGPTVKRFEMSRATFYEIECRMNLVPHSDPCSTLWGIQIVFDNRLPLNEIKPIYE